MTRLEEARQYAEVLRTILVSIAGRMTIGEPVEWKHLSFGDFGPGYPLPWDREKK